MATHHHTQYVHYTGPPRSHVAHTTHTSTPTSIQPSLLSSTPSTSPSTPAVTTVAPKDTTYVHPHRPLTAAQPQQTQPQQPQPQPPAVQPQAQHSDSSTLAVGGTQGPLIATGDWTKNLVHLAKTAELKKHALTLQLHTAHILSAHATLEQRSKSIQDVREQKNKLESERTRLLNSLRQVNEDRDKADMLESSLEKECADLRTKITSLSEGEYAVAKRDVDRLRQELGEAPLPSLQSMLDEKSSQYLNERRLNGQSTSTLSASTPTPATPTSSIPITTITTSASFSVPITPATHKRTADEAMGTSSVGSVGKRPRGRPRGSKNKKSVGETPDAGGVQGTL